MKKVLSLLSAALFAALICTAPAAHAGAPSAFYDSANCGNWIFSMDPGVQWSWLWPEQNDRVSSIAVGGGTRVEIYENINYGGAPHVFENWKTAAVCMNVPWALDNKTSSIKTFHLF